MKSRIFAIDYLRGLAMVAMMVIHTTVYFLSDPSGSVLWNYSQWAVPVFVFCSGYVFFKSKGKNSERISLAYLKKRFIRLLLPYYLFVPVFFLVLLLVDPTKLSIGYIVQSIILTGGIDINWLVLLFLQFSLLMPLFLWLWQRKLWFFLYFFVSLLCSILLIFIHSPFSYKWIMWLPWSTVLLFSLLLANLPRLQTPKFLILITVVSGVLYIIVREVLVTMKHSLHFIDNKYPPNFFFLIFGIGCTAILFFLAEEGLFTIFKKPLFFLSTYSYSIYFIHYTFLILFANTAVRYHWGWEVYLCVILVSSVITQWLILQLQKVWKQHSLISHQSLRP